MLRSEMLKMLEEQTEWDIIIIGGGATGLGAAVDASSRGYKTLLLEQYDFAKGTSSRSTKLVHGGVRYLAQGNIKLVLEALKERGLLLQNAPHLTHNQSFVLPSYKWWEKWYYGIGLKLYDIMSGKLSLGKTSLLSRKKTMELLPAADMKGLSGGVLYHDGQFDDSRLAINLAQTAAEQGACLLNYFDVYDLQKKNKKIKGVLAEDLLTQKEYQFGSAVVINATGVFTDDILQMDDDQQHHIVAPSQGIHVVIDKKYFPGDNAMMIPKTDDGRVLFAVPWHGKVIVGTTDTPVEEVSAEPLAQEEEIEFIMKHLNRYLNTGLTRPNIRSVFAGLRPLVKVSGQKNTALTPRDHTIIVSASGLVTITGGKWTTYRKMAKDAVDNAVFVGRLPRKDCITQSLHLHGWCEFNNPEDHLHFYGADAVSIRKIWQENPEWKEKIHAEFPYTWAELIWAIRHEMAMTVEDLLARRIRLLFLDARAAIEVAPAVASMMAREMGKESDWEIRQTEEFTALARGYLPDPR
jgi:glycerol-3-phosphate dehydrogenase